MTDLAPTLLNVACIDGRWCWMERVPTPKRHWWTRKPVPASTYRPGVSLTDGDLDRLLFADAHREASAPRPPNRAVRRAATRNGDRR